MPDDPRIDPEDPGEHDPDGLGLAGQIARAYRGRPVRRRRLPGQRPQPRSEERRETGEPAPVGGALDRLISDYGWSEALAVNRLLGGWSQLVGPDIAENTQVLGYEDGVVVVQAATTAWATQLRLLAPTIVAKLNDRLGDGKVLRIDIRNPSGPSWKKGPRSAPGRGPRDTYG